MPFVKSALYMVNEGVVDSIIILEKISNDNRYELLDLLENIGFQAPNCIELFDDTYIFTAKKMHHWDNGL